jgi:hypothetical protein
LNTSTLRLILMMRATCLIRMISTISMTMKSTRAMMLRKPTVLKK